MTKERKDGESSTNDTTSEEAGREPVEATRTPSNHLDMRGMFNALAETPWRSSGPLSELLSARDRSGKESGDEVTFEPDRFPSLRVSEDGCYQITASYLCSVKVSTLDLKAGDTVRRDVIVYAMRLCGCRARRRQVMDIHRVDTSYPKRGTWYLTPDGASRICCPECLGTTMCSDPPHTIADDGSVNPSWVCPYPGCVFHAWIQLVGGK